MVRSILLFSEIRFKGASYLGQSRDQSLKGEVSRAISGVHAGHVLELTRLTDVALRWQNDLLLDRLFLLLSWDREADVLRAGDQSFDVLPQIVRCFWIVKAEAREARVIRGETHRVERWPGYLVR